MKEKEIVVQKYGGATISTIERIKKVAEYIRKVSNEKGVVVVVSAMGDETDKLLEMARQICDAPPSREVDKLLVTGEEKSAALMTMAIQNEGTEAVSFTGFQIGLETDPTYAQARVKGIREIEKIKSFLREGKVPVVAGFQGVIEGTNEIVTLGRGGSDLTAIALAGALKASYCEIYKDVDGIHVIDPRNVPKARKFKWIDYRQMIDLSGAGAGVLMDRCVILAQNLGVKIKVLLSPSFGETDGGTLVCSGSTVKEMEGLIWVRSGIAIQKRLALVNVSEIPNKPGMAGKIFGAVSEINIVDTAQGRGEEKANISILCQVEDLSRVFENLQKIEEVKISSQSGIVALTLVYPLMKEEQGCLHRVCQAIGKVGVNIETISSSGTSILVSINEEELLKAARALAEEFELLER